MQYELVEALSLPYDRNMRSLGKFAIMISNRLLMIAQQYVRNRGSIGSVLDRRLAKVSISAHKRA